MVPSHRRVPPDSLTPRAKTHNYLNLVVADHEVQAVDPEAWAILLDVNGNLAEGLGSNIFVVRDGEILTPREKFVLPGVSRQTAMDLARQEGFTVSETDHRPLRRLQRRRDVPHLDLALHLPGGEGERRRRRRRQAKCGGRSRKRSPTPTSASSTSTSSTSIWPLCRGDGGPRLLR